MTSLTTWNRKHYLGGDGVIVATDMKQEWLLKWWWNHYSQHSHYPVTFFDLGMSKSARLWCEAKGSVIPFSFPEGWIKPKEAVDPKQYHVWEEKYPGNIWEGRTQWFAKPFLLLKSPYKRTIWMDLDCEVRRPIDPLFDFANEKHGFSILKIPLDDIEVYNTGVIVSLHGSPIPPKWAENTQKNNHKHFGDEPALMDMIKQEKLEITPHPLIYNWPTLIPQDPNTVIRHHVGSYAKTRILAELYG